MKKFKEEDLILYLYKECSPSLTTAIDQALEAHDIELEQQLKMLQRSIRQLNKLKLASPAKQSVAQVMKYAAEAARKKH